MGRKGLYVLLFSGALLFLAAGSVFSQETNITQELQTETQVTAEKDRLPAAGDLAATGKLPDTGEPETQWLWGEVVSVDKDNKTVSVKYLDYETDAEKEINLNTDETTMYDNIDSIGGLKAKDTISVDYVVSADGKYIAKVISLEKVEETPGAVE